MRERRSVQQLAAMLAQIPAARQKWRAQFGPHLRAAEGQGACETQPGAAVVLSDIGISATRQSAKLSSQRPRSAARPERRVTAMVASSARGPTRVLA
mmetsp:Transcript_78863/g.254754  ORF Transcript_78863/g.254754 Transcript_78863/m.254754 type:complete len:97 (-) Transcript_78863:37-327(-)